MMRVTRKELFLTGADEIEVRNSQGLEDDETISHSAHVERS